VLVRQRADKTGIIGPVKSKAGRRTIYLPALVTDKVFEWRERCPKSKHDLIFPTDSGKPILLHNFTSAWTSLLREAGLTVKEKEKEKEKESGKTVERLRYTPYAPRHYYASKLIQQTQGKDLKYIQEAMGHSSIEITFDVYGHLIRGNEEARKRDAEGLAASILQY
jgi:integrase